MKVTEETNKCRKQEETCCQKDTAEQEGYDRGHSFKRITENNTTNTNRQNEWMLERILSSNNLHRAYKNVFTDNSVEQYTNEGGSLKLVGKKVNLSGLPIIYHSDNELNEVEGRSDLDDWIEILDSMEDLISKYTDAFYKYMNPIPVAIGQQLKGDGIPSNIVGGGLTLDDGSDFKLVSNGLDYQSFESIYKTLLQSLLDIAQVPFKKKNCQHDLFSFKLTQIGMQRDAKFCI